MLIVIRCILLCGETNNQEIVNELLKNTNAMLTNAAGQHAVTHLSKCNDCEPLPVKRLSMSALNTNNKF